MLASKQKEVQEKMETNLDIENILNEVRKSAAQKSSTLSFGEVWQTFEKRKKEKSTQVLLFSSLLGLLVLIAVNCSALYRNHNAEESKMNQMAQDMHLLNNNSIYG